MASPFQDLPCTVAIGNTYDTHGTITQASLTNLTPTQIEAFFKPDGSYADMDASFLTQLEMKACGTRIQPMYEWLRSSFKNVGNLLHAEPMDRGPGLLRPFIMGRQDSVVNKEFWVITSGWANNAYTPEVTGPLTAGQQALGAAGDRIIRVITNYGFDLDSKWFVNRDRIHIFSTSFGASQRGQWKVLASEVAADLSYIDVLIDDENAGSTTPYSATPGANMVIMPGTNNVSDYENFCENRPALNPRRHVPYWYKTDRRGRRIDSEYQKVIARLSTSNKYFDLFRNLPLAEYNRQDEEQYQSNWAHDFFFSKKISANQTLANWQSLERINSFAAGTLDGGDAMLQEFRANPVGAIEQLQACGRVIDLGNTPLNFYEWLDENYRIMRARKSQGRFVETLDWYTDQQNAANIETAFVNYLRAEYGDIVRINIETGGNELGFSWKIFSNLKYPVGLKIALVTSDFHDDMVNAFGNEDIASVGRVLWCLDIGKPGPKGGTIYPGKIKSNRKTRTLGEIEGMARVDMSWACVMENPTQHITLTSETWTTIVECPANSLAIHGLADGVPSTAGRTTPYTDLLVEAVRQ